MTALGVKTLPIQPRETFTCPAWCAADHDRGALDEWEYGQWTVQHEGAEVRWETSRGTEMTAQLKWTEIVGSSPIIVEGFLDLVGPTIELAGDDGSGYMGTHEIVAQDWLEWQRVLSELWKQVQA
jgi:hypothetical protein